MTWDPNSRGHSCSRLRVISGLRLMTGPDSLGTHGNVGENIHSSTVPKPSSPRVSESSACDFLRSLLQLDFIFELHSMA